MNSNTDRMMGMITGYWVTQIVHAAATFSFADHLEKGGATAEEIARVEVWEISDFDGQFDGQ